ncbi:YveK family protein [Brevibacillus sp. B_LB10_24]|uniref:YveK family protein n=1 Tax=Brevibacillus sp. B_LB10_24 TaxID=3380645 RepID=UPI0038BD290F
MDMVIDVLTTIRKRWFLTLAVAAIAGIATGLIQFFVLVPKYQATTTLLVQPQNTNNMNIYTSSLGNQQLLKTYTELIKSRRIAEDVIRKMQSTITPAQLLEKVAVKINNGTFLFSITITDQNAALAVRYANAFSQSITENANLFMNIDNVMVIDEAEGSSNPVPIGPKPYVSIPISVVLGFMVGVVLALFFEMVDRAKHASSPRKKSFAS